VQCIFIFSFFVLHASYISKEFIIMGFNSSLISLFSQHPKVCSNFVRSLLLHESWDSFFPKYDADKGTEINNIHLFRFLFLKWRGMQPSSTSTSCSFCSRSSMFMLMKELLTPIWKRHKDPFSWGVNHYKFAQKCVRFHLTCHNFFLFSQLPSFATSLKSRNT